MPAGGARGRLIVTIGPPGAGKTTWRATHMPAGAVVVSLDELRAKYSPCGCSSDPGANAAATEQGVALTRDTLAAGGTVLWDVTAYKPAFRRRLLALAAGYRVRTVGVVILPPVGLALARNGRRDPRICPVCRTARRVPEDVLTAMHHAITTDLPRLPVEGWHTLHFRPPQHDLSEGVA
ncbi:AAA family ATPase [Amycolatopsis nigrescens]|uniref:AAA family ATPase n=1 Tax=Amycolatopsis nigrescens TaxID=381445 RepID=UPI000368CAC7|nr:AAA family ATPase [Amycolatopsis nigrescens]